jgi:hypothetical protein
MTGAGKRASSLAVVVVSYNVRDLLRACLSATFASLARSPELEATVHVVDNASRDGSAEMVAREFPDVHLTASPDNLGFAGGNNRVMRHLGFDAPAAPDFALLLNPDAEPLGDAIGQMARFLRERKDAGAAGAQLQYADGSFQHGAFAFPGLLQLWFDLFPRGRAGCSTPGSMAATPARFTTRAGPSRLTSRSAPPLWRAAKRSPRRDCWTRATLCTRKRSTGAGGCATRGGGVTACRPRG